MKKQASSAKFTAQKYIYALIAVALICIMGSIYKKKRVEKALLARAHKSAQEKLKNNQALTPSERASLGQKPESKSQQSKNNSPQNSLSLQRPPVVQGPEADEVLRARNTEAVQSFSRETHMDVQLPSSFSYSKLDTDEGFEGIYGENDLQKAKLTGLAYNKVATVEQVTQFLKTDADSIPNITKNPIQFMGNPEPLPPPSPGSGLGPGTLWNGKLANGDSVAAVFIPRSDGNGSYLFVLSGPDSYFENNDGSFDSVYEKAKALPPHPARGR